MLVYIGKYENEQYLPFSEGEELKHPYPIGFYTEYQNGLYPCNVPNDFINQYNQNKIGIRFENGILKTFEL